MATYHGYTIDDMLAMAAARGCPASYGLIQQALEFGAPLPPLKRSTKWPKGSSHLGEEIMPWDVPDRKIPEAAPQEVQPAPRALAKGMRWCSCDHCGSRIPLSESVRLYIRLGTVRPEFGEIFAHVCRCCASQVLPKEKPKKFERAVLIDEATGERVPTKRIARCSSCGKLFAKAGGAGIFTCATDSGYPVVADYICGNCLPAWKKSIKKSPQAE